VAQTMYTFESKYKNNKIKEREKINLKKNDFSIAVKAILG
jgi:hypothetical protein